MKIKTFRDLIAWQKAHQVSIRTYAMTKSFPQDERFGLSSQMRRASVSITSNLAEGYGRRSIKDKKHFFVMASASAAELQSQITISKDLNYISEQNFLTLDKNLIEVQKITSGLIRSLNRLF